MFRDYIYLNSDKILNYGRKLGLNNNLFNNEDKLIAEEMYFEEFENKLENEHKDSDFFDLCGDNEEKIINIKKQTIIRFEKELFIPREFGQVEFIQKAIKNDSIKKYLTNYICNENDIPSDFVYKLLRDRGSVPIYFNFDSYKIYSNLQGKCFRNIEYVDFEENVDEIVTVVARVENISNIEKEIILYNVYKDLLGLGRELRRTIKTNDKQSNSMPEEIRILGKGIKIDVLGIYK